MLYRSPAALDQAFAELRATRSSCDRARFHDAPDRRWADVRGVERLAYSFTTPGRDGTAASKDLAVYLRRGRVFLGLYFGEPDGIQPGVGGQTSVQGIVELMQGRLAALPDSVVNRGG